VKPKAARRSITAGSNSRKSDEAVISAIADEQPAASQIALIGELGLLRGFGPCWGVLKMIVYARTAS